MAAAILLFCFQGAGRATKSPRDLVQMERKNKALRGFVHQVRVSRAPKSPRDLVQMERKNKALRGFVHQVRAGRAPASAAHPPSLRRHLKKATKKRATSVARSWCAIRGSNPGHPD